MMGERWNQKKQIKKKHYNGPNDNTNLKLEFKHALTRLDSITIRKLLIIYFNLKRDIQY